MGLFFLFATFVLWGMSAVVALWLGFAFPLLNTRAFTWLAPLAVTAFILFGISFTRTHYGWGTGALYYAAYILFGFVFLAFCVTAVCAVLQGLLSWTGSNPRAWLGPVSAGVMGVVFILSLWGGFSSPRIKRISVTSPTLPKLKIAVVSDSHLGRGVSLARFDKALAKLEAEKPDVLLVLGDVFEYGTGSDAYAARLKQFVTPLGSYGVLGNHEYYVGYGDSVDFYNRAGITLLQNELAALPNGVWVAGLKDIKTAGVTAQETTALLQKAPHGAPLILLSHTPLYAEQAAAAGVNLMLSGHTHNGQLWPFKYLVQLQFPRIYGLFEVAGMPFYITSGMFYWGIPLRFLAPAELPVIEVN